jgi:thymidylate synthase ThyX
MVLPQSMMTEWYWSGSLDAFADMCRLRITPDTQYETRQVAIDDRQEDARAFPSIVVSFRGSWDTNTIVLLNNLKRVLVIL